MRSHGRLGEAAQAASPTLRIVLGEEGPNSRSVPVVVPVEQRNWVNLSEAR